MEYVWCVSISGHIQIIESSEELARWWAVKQGLFQYEIQRWKLGCKYGVQS